MGGGKEGELDQAGCQRAPKLTLSPPTWVFTKLESQRQPGNCLPYPPKSCHSLPSKHLHQAFPSSFIPIAGALGQTLPPPLLPSCQAMAKAPPAGLLPPSASLQFGVGGARSFQNAHLTITFLSRICLRLLTAYEIKSKLLGIRTLPSLASAGLPQPVCSPPLHGSHCNVCS